MDTKISNIQQINKLAPVRCGSYFEIIIFNLIKQNSSLGSHCEIILRWMWHDLTNIDIDLCRHMTSLGHND